MHDLVINVVERQLEMRRMKMLFANLSLLIV